MPQLLYAKHDALRFTLFVFLVLQFGSLDAQVYRSKANIPKVISPQAYEFVKYTEVPVSNYTGVPRIEVPLYTISAAGFEVPVLLSYHSNGIKVSEEASHVGLGWSLNGGGSIIHVVNGIPDNSLWGAFDAIDPTEFGTPGGFSNCQSKIITYTDDQNVMPNVSHGLIRPIVEGVRDGERDVYKYNFPGYSGEFVYDYETSTYVSLTDKNVVIKYTSSSNTFDITVPEGHSFRFAVCDPTIYDAYGTTVFPGEPIPQPVDLKGFAASRAYQLTLIQTNKGEEINYLYEFTNSVKNFPSVSVADIENKISVYSIKGPNTHKLFPPWQNSYTYVATSQRLSYLKKIQSNKVLIEFTNASGRTDINGAMQLNAIVVKDRTNGAVIASYSLAYDYFQGHSNGPNMESEMQLANKSVNEKLQRLKLLSVTEQGSEPFEFTYYPGLLPSKATLMFDHWGFYNNYSKSTMMSRGPSDEASTRIGLLESITYPTGGKAKFNYELNTLDDPKVAPHYKESSGTVFLMDRNWTNPYTNDPGDFSYVVGPTSAWIMVPKEGHGYVDVQRILSVMGPCASNPNSEMYYPNASWQIVSYDSVAGELVETFGWSSIPQFVSNAARIKTSETGKIKVGENQFKEWPAMKMALAPGVYFFSVGLNDVCGAQDAMGEDALAFMKLSYSVSTLLDPVVGTGAGLRIKDISMLDENNVQQKLTAYTYTGPRLMSKPVYETKNQLRFNHLDFDASCQTDPASCCHSASLLIDIKVRSNRSIMEPSTNASGNFVGYDQVTVRDIDFRNASNNGYVVYTYVNQPDRVEIDYDNVSLPTVKPDRENGLLLSEVYYNNSDKPLQAVEYDYVDVKEPCFWATRARMTEQRLVFIHTESCSSAETHYYALGFYPLKRTKTLLKSKTSIQYDGDRQHTVKEQFQYDTRDLLRKEDITDSQGDVQTTEYTYPYDYPTDVVLKEMVKQNAIDQTVTEEVKKNGVLTSYEKNEFKEIFAITNVFDYKFYERSILSSKYTATGQLQKEYEVQLFDKDKPLQFVDRGGVVTSFIWGYNKEYVVAKVTGATHSQAMALVNASVLNAPSSESALRAELAKIRAGLPGAMVISYTHRPLFGVSSVTDENGLTEYYEYDNNRRLVVVKDQSGNIVKHHFYHILDR